MKIYVIGKTTIQKLTIKASKGLIIRPIKVLLMCDRFNYSVGKLKYRRNNIKESVDYKEFKNEINKEYEKSKVFKNWRDCKCT